MSFVLLLMFFARFIALTPVIAASTEEASSSSYGSAISTSYTYTSASVVEGFDAFNYSSVENFSNNISATPVEVGQFGFTDSTQELSSTATGISVWQFGFTSPTSGIYTNTGVQIDRFGFSHTKTYAKPTTIVGHKGRKGYKGHKGRTTTTTTGTTCTEISDQIVQSDYTTQTTVPTSRFEFGQFGFSNLLSGRTSVATSYQESESGYTTPTTVATSSTARFEFGQFGFSNLLSGRNSVTTSSQKVRASILPHRRSRHQPRHQPTLFWEFGPRRWFFNLFGFRRNSVTTSSPEGESIYTTPPTVTTPATTSANSRFEFGQFGFSNLLSGRNSVTASSSEGESIYTTPATVTTSGTARFELGQFGFSN
ncbi:hypothetical protein JCM33374_g4796, partial [Metschnikowia sp. JCM 33374]